MTHQANKQSIKLFSQQKIEWTVILRFNHLHSLLHIFKFKEKIKTGYDNQTLIELIIEKTKNEKQNIYSGKISNKDLNVLSAISLIEKNEMSVVDFGGGAGIHGIVATRIFKGIKNIQWNTIETEEMVSKSKEFIKLPHIKFFSDLEQYRKIYPRTDILFCDSSLQYINDPNKKIRDFLKLKAKILYFTRIPLSSSQENFSYLQKSRLSENGPGTYPQPQNDSVIGYQCNIISLQKFLSHFKPDYDLIFMINAGPWNPRVLGESVNSYTIALRLKK